MAYSTSMSRWMSPATFGRSTLTTTALPSASLAACTCAIDAAASGVRIAIGVVAFDSAPVVAARLGIVRAPREKTRLITLETLGRLAAA